MNYNEQTKTQINSNSTWLSAKLPNQLVIPNDHNQIPNLQINEYQCRLPHLIHEFTKVNKFD